MVRPTSYWWALLGLVWSASAEVLANADGPLVLIYTERIDVGTPQLRHDAASDSDRLHLEIHRSDHELVVCRGSERVKSYLIAVGRPGWETPVGDYKVFQLVRNPAWKHPLTGKIYESGDAKNELGHYWIGFYGNDKGVIGFHGTPHPETVGKTVSHGCIRMFESDIAELYSEVRMGTQVTVTQ